MRDIFSLRFFRFFLRENKKLNNTVWLCAQMRASSGQSRWEPAVSEYIINPRDDELHEVAEKLLLTQDPQYVVSSRFERSFVFPRIM